MAFSILRDPGGGGCVVSLLSAAGAAGGNLVGSDGFRLGALFPGYGGGYAWGGT